MPCPEFALDAGQQFGARQAVQAKVTLKGTVQTQMRHLWGVGPQLARQALHDTEHPLRIDSAAGRRAGLKRGK
jgi:hypothetical protein